MYFAVTVTGTYGSHNALSIFVSAVLLYILFLLLMSTNPTIIMTVITILFITYIVETQKYYYNRKDKVKFAVRIKQLSQIQLLLSFVVLGILIGYSGYKLWLMR